MTKPRITIEIDEKLKKDVKVKASLQGRTIKEIVVNLLKRWLKQ